jgi:peptidoglycan/xylan/chitin deacetylase (PgdA/CDA1 family)
MYHEIADGQRGLEHPYYYTTTSESEFDKQIRFLSENGYRSVGLAEALQRAAAAAEQASRRIVITFDDGYQSFYTKAFPILCKYGFAATVFLPTAFIGDTRRLFKGIGCLTWNEVRYLNSRGIDFGSHTVDHPQLRDLQRSEIVCQLRSSRCAIEDELGSRVTTFAYPYAFPEADRVFVPVLRDLLVESGYEYGVSTIIGTVGDTSDPYFMPRLPINSDDDTRLFAAKLQGAYNWLHTIQYVRKLCWQKRGSRSMSATEFGSVAP